MSVVIRFCTRCSQRLTAVGRPSPSSFSFPSPQQQQPFTASASNDENNNSSNSNSNHSAYTETPTLPCYLSKFDAIESFVEWVKKQHLAPKNFRNDPKKFIHSIDMYYIPFYHFEASARSEFHASVAPDAKVDDKRLWVGECSFVCLFSFVVYCRY